MNNFTLETLEPVKTLTQPLTIYEKIIIYSLIFMHWIMFSGTIMIILATNDLSILVLANMFLFLILTMNILYKECPITIIENKYLGTTMMELMGSFIPFRSQIIKQGSTLQWIFMAIMVSTTKIILLLLKVTFLEYVNTGIISR